MAAELVVSAVVHGAILLPLALPLDRAKGRAQSIIELPAAADPSEPRTLQILGAGEAERRARASLDEIPGFVRPSAPASELSEERLRVPETARVASLEPAAPAGKVDPAPRRDPTPAAEQALAELAAAEPAANEPPVAEPSQQVASRSEQQALAAVDPALLGQLQTARHDPGPPSEAPQVEAPVGAGAGDAIGRASMDGSADLRRLVQERINHVTRLIAPSAVMRAGRTGVAVLMLKVDGRGYVHEAHLVRSTSSPALDRELEPVLHLAEPYPLWEGWLKVAVDFRLGARL